MKIGHKVKYTRIGRAEGAITIKTGELTIRIIKRRAKFDGWNGQDAYVMGDDGKYPRWPTLSSGGKVQVMFRKIEKLKGIELDSL